MSSDTVLRTRVRTASGARSRSSCCRRKDSPICMSIPRRATMHLRNNSLLIVLLMIIAAPATWLLAQQQDQVTPEELERLPRATTSAPEAAPQPNNNTVTPPGGSQQQQQQQPSPTGTGQVQQRGDQYLIRTEVQEVQLYASVYDQRQRMVTNLRPTDFAVYENNETQKITSFRL